MLENEQERCASCEAELNGAYCASCGQRRMRPDEYSVRRLLSDGISDAFSVDAKLWRSFWTLFVRPGRLTVDYMEGRRSGRLGPLQLFLVANLVYFFVQPFSGFSGYNTPLNSHMERQFYSEAAGIAPIVLNELESRIDARVRVEGRARAARGEAWTEADSLRFHERASAVEREVYPTSFNARGEVLARSLVIVIVPLMTLALLLLYAWPVRPLVQHVVFATHIVAWGLTFISSFALPIWLRAMRFLQRTIGTVGGEAGQELVTSEVGRRVFSMAVENGSMILQLPYLYIALRVVYGSGRIGSIGRVVFLIAWGLFATVSYRFLLFWLTFANT